MEEVLKHLRTMRDTWKEVMRTAHASRQKQWCAGYNRLTGAANGEEPVSFDHDPEPEEKKCGLGCEELENPGLDPDDFDACVEEKAKQIEQLELLDTGFQEVYDKIKADLQTNQQEYREEIAEMQEYIRRLTDKSATIQAQEARNKDLMTQKFASVRKQVKEVRKSQKVVNQYYKSMMKSGYMEPQFTDNKK